MVEGIDAARRLAHELNLPIEGVAATIALLDEGNTLPFIARYRKERTGGLDEDDIRRLEAALASLRALEARRAAILAALEEAGTLTPELAASLAAA
ncbi:MAG TPA: Tex-like N-terminal domain-containing protein, partial [Thermomicrobiales bacterium]